MSTSTEVEEEIRHLDWDAGCMWGQFRPRAVFGLFVRWVADTCEKPAQWVMTCAKCGITGPCCDDHVKFVTQHPAVSCVKCGTSGPGSAVFTVTAL